MRLNLKKPLVVFDLETTGLDLVNDRIIQISFLQARRAVFGTFPHQTETYVQEGRKELHCNCDEGT